MKRGAFSLIEVVLSLALMSTLVAAAVTWTSASLRIQQTRQHTMDPARTIELLERAVRVDLLQLDATPMNVRPRINADVHSLQIRTRDRGPQTVRYSFDPSTNTMARAVNGGQTHVIAHAVTVTFELKIDQDEHSATLRTDVNSMGLQSSFINRIPARWVR